MPAEIPESQTPIGVGLSLFRANSPLKLGCRDAVGRLRLCDYSDDEFVDYISAIYSDCSEATRERDPFLFAGVAAAASLATSGDFDAAPGVRLRAGVVPLPSAETVAVAVGVAARAGAAVGDTVGPVSASGLRPKPSALANSDRRSE